MLPLIIFCVITGVIVGSIAGVFTSFTTGVVVGAIMTVVAFAAFLVAGFLLVNRASPENACESLSDWLKAENGIAPDKCEVVYDEEGPWPLEAKTERIFLCRYSYQSDDEIEDGIGVAWPNCFVLYGLDFDQFTHQELLACYRGVYIVLMGRSNGMDAKTITGKEWEQLSEVLESQGYDASVSCDDLRSQAIRPEPGTLLFSVEVKRDGKPIIAVGNLADPTSIESRDPEKFSVPVAHYHWVNQWWMATRTSGGS